LLLGSLILVLVFICLVIGALQVALRVKLHTEEEAQKGNGSMPKSDRNIENPECSSTWIQSTKLRPFVQHHSYFFSGAN
jgi:hypothetical protein